MAISPKSHLLVVGCIDILVKHVKWRGSGISVFDLISGEQLAPWTGHDGSVVSLQFSSDGETLASSSLDGAVIIWDVSEQKRLKTLTGHRSHAFSVAWSPDGQTLASGCEDGTVKLWDVASGEELTTFQHDRGIVSVAFSPDGRSLAALQSDGLITMRHADIDRRDWPRRIR